MYVFLKKLNCWYLVCIKWCSLLLDQYPRLLVFFVYMKTMQIGQCIFYLHCKFRNCSPANKVWGWYIMVRSFVCPNLIIWYPLLLLNSSTEFQVPFGDYSLNAALLTSYFQFYLNDFGGPQSTTWTLLTDFLVFIIANNSNYKLI